MNIKGNFEQELATLIKSIRDSELLHDADKMERIAELQERRRDLEAFFEMGVKSAVPEGFVLVPKEPTKDMQDALGFMCFQIIGVAELYRKLGFDIPYKAEAEQAFFLYRFMLLALEHGENWKSVFNAETQVMIEAQEKNND